MSAPEPAQPLERLHTVGEVAAALGISAQTLRRWIRTGRVTTCRQVGRAVRFTAEDYRQTLAALRAPAVDRLAARRRTRRG